MAQQNQRNLSHSSAHSQTTLVSSGQRAAGVSYLSSLQKEVQALIPTAQPSAPVLDAPTSDAAIPDHPINNTNTSSPPNSAQPQVPDSKRQSWLKLEIENNESDISDSNLTFTETVSEKLGPFKLIPTVDYNSYDTYGVQEAPDHNKRSELFPSFPAGVIEFVLPDEDEVKDRYFVQVEKDTNLDDVARFMSVAWHRRTPLLVLSIISSSYYFKQWSKPKFAEDFRDGIIQAANSTAMWILTEGLDHGVSKLIGDAVQFEMTRRKKVAQNPLKIENVSRVERLPRLNVFGITSKSSIVYRDRITGTSCDYEVVTNEGGNPENYQYDLNPNHTHFILMEDGGTADIEGLNSFRLSLEMRFSKPIGKLRHLSRFYISGQPITRTSSKDSFLSDVYTPLIGLLVQGSPSDVDHVLWLLQKKTPVVVIQGSGLAADLVAFAYNEMEQRPDPSYLDSYIKGELMRRVSDTFPDDFASNDVARNLFRDRIIECVKLNYQDDMSYLTIVNADFHGVRMNDISKYILIALMKSRKTSFIENQLLVDLQLILDWNRPDLARSEIFSKCNFGNMKATDHLVHSALLLPGHEEFVELFLENDLMLHSYLNQRRLHNLFEHPEDKDFFVSCCLEGVLGRAVNPDKPVCQNFVVDTNCELNRLLFRLTGLRALVDPQELNVNCEGGAPSKDVAERSATNALIFWAVLTGRFRMAKVLWSHAENPMAAALVISMILHRLGTDWCKKDLDMSNRIKKAGAEFGKLAVNLLDLSYRESYMFTFAALGKPLGDFNKCTLIELAELGENKYFISHPSCQKWLTRRWYGDLRIREITWGPPWVLPVGIKIYLSVFLFFPMFLWIAWQEDQRSAHETFDEDDIEDSPFLSTMGHQEQSNSLDYQRDRRKSKDQLRRNIRGRKPQKSKRYCKVDEAMDFDRTTRLPFYRKMYILHSAPITKFWMAQLFQMLYLILLSLAVLQPDCGDLILNNLLLAWTIAIEMELVRKLVIKRVNRPEDSFFYDGLLVGMIFLFLLLIGVFRPHSEVRLQVSFVTIKFFMSIYLIFFYFHFLVTTVPVSPTLGPLLVSVIDMTRKDFSDWLRLFVLILVSGAVSIQAVIYPSYPLGVDSLRQAFSRAIFGLFLTKIDDLDGKDSCSYLFEEDAIKYCHTERYANNSVRGMVETCPNKSIYNYAIVIPYLLNAKLIFITLLYAMFSVTCARVYNESLEIWRYQRYGLIVEFERRMILPVPLSILCYIYYSLRWLFVWTYGKCRYLSESPCCRTHHSDKDNGTTKMPERRSVVDFTYWRECMNQYRDVEISQQMEQKRAQLQSTNLMELLEQMSQQQQLTRHLNDRMVQLESNFTNSCVLLEEIKHLVSKIGTDPTTQQQRNLPHISSRQSPYCNTQIRRYPVFDKYVPWEVPYDSYDPISYSKPVSSFEETIQMFVDPDVLELIEEQTKRQGLSAEELEQLPPLPEFRPEYNEVLSQTVENMVIEVDRTSWMSVDGHPVRYNLDILTMPINPQGRTGLRGRGKLWRFGPNHRITAVVTRWRRKPVTKEYLTLEGKKVMEVIVVPRPQTGELTLPGGNVYGKTTAYSVLCDEFLSSVFNETDTELEEGSTRITEESMINWFSQFVRKPAGQSKVMKTESPSPSSGFKSSLLYRGYLDDPANTDNAWREAEVWNFHYDINDIFDEKMGPQKDKMWQEVTPSMHLFGNQESLALEAARNHKAYL